MEVTVKVFNKAGEEDREFTLEVEQGKGWKKRAEIEAMKHIRDDESIQVMPPIRYLKKTKYQINSNLHLNLKYITTVCTNEPLN